MIARRIALMACWFVLLGCLMPPVYAYSPAASSGWPVPAATSANATGFVSGPINTAFSSLVAANESVFYGPPYSYSLGCTGGGRGFETVGAAINAWWDAYRGCYARFFPCYYTLYNDPTGPTSGHFAYMPLGGNCGGGDSVYGTAYSFKAEKTLGKPCNCVGDAIDFGTGNEYRDDADISLGSLSFHRFYNSHQAVASTSVGAHWRHTFDRSVEYLTDVSSSIATVFRPDGRQLRFVLQSGAWVADSDVADTLSPVYSANTNALAGWFYIDAETLALESYDAQGRLQSIADANRQRTTFAYSDASTPASIAPVAGLLLAVTDPLGRKLSFTYNDQSRVATITQPDGSAISYSYDAIGNLIKVAYPDSTYRQYIYNESALTANTNLPHALTGEIDEKGVRLTDIGYDSQGRAVLSRAAGGVDVTQVSYGSNKTSTVTYPSGVQVTYGFSTPSGTLRASSASGPCGPSCGQGFASQAFDANGYATQAVDFNGHITRTSYSPLGLLLSKTEAYGESTQRTTTSSWDTANRVPLTRTVTDAGGSVKARTGWAYNARAQVVAYCHMDSALADSYVCAPGGSVPTGVRRWVYTYCDAVDNTQCPLAGLLLSVDGPRLDALDVTRYSYYSSTDESGCGAWGGACHRAGDLYQVVNAAGQATRFLAYDTNGRVVRQSDANGVITDFTYSPRGWLVKRVVRASVDGSPSSSDAITEIDYDATGNVVKVTDPDGVFFGYTYDGAHRLTDITDALGHRIHYTLDSAGHKTKEQIVDALGTVRSSISRSFNALGQLTKITDGLSHPVFNATYSDSYDPEGNLIHVADALGIQRKYVYDGLKRLVSSIDNYNGVDTATKDAQVVFAYDTMDRLQGISDPDGLNTIYGYDGLGQLITLQSPDTGSSLYVGDAAGNVIQSTNAKGDVKSNAYDVLNRRTATAYADSSLNAALFYDEPSNVTGCPVSYPVGRLTRMVETNATTTYCYDAHGNVIRKSQVQGASVDVTTYSYTTGDRLASISSPSGTSVQYTRDAVGRISGVTVLPPGASGAGAGNVVTAISYMPFGPVASYTLGNGQTITRTYDANYALTDLVSPSFNLHFERDAGGSIAALGNAPGANPSSEAYAYDPLYRLTTVASAGVTLESYTYNKTGDRLSKTSSGLGGGVYSYKNGTHQLTSVGNAQRVSDANGNTTASVVGGEAFGFGYNGRNRLSVTQRNGQTVGTYTYNALGQRIKKMAALPQASATRYVYDETDHLIGEYGVTRRDYVWLGDIPVAVVDAAGEIAGPGVAVTPLQNGVAVKLSGQAGSTTSFGMAVPAGARALVLRTFGGTGDVTLYVKYGTPASATIYDFVSKHVGNSESVTVARPLAGIYYLALVGESPGYANVSVQ
ncbi:DUF6531 domain-containing protein, partial [Dyella sp. ASV21]|uniref:DUF6531 domain-containing protein n=1 Tax=Dyella sp. ASV21 TaxID=2795114 RepID=UPI0018ED96A2